MYHIFFHKKNKISFGHKLSLNDPLEVEAERSLQIVRVCVVQPSLEYGGGVGHHLLCVVQAVVRVLTRVHWLP